MMRKVIFPGRTGAAILLAASWMVPGDQVALAGPGSETWGTLPSDTRIVGVDAALEDVKAHAGPVAIEGVVSTVFTERRAFTLIDRKEFSSCGVTTCAENSVPVRVPEYEFQGALPQERDTVLVIGELEPQGKGFRLQVQEVRGVGGLLIRRTGEPPAGRETIREHERKLAEE